jgi:hypothetical protein
MILSLYKNRRLYGTILDREREREREREIGCGKITEKGIEKTNFRAALCMRGLD